MRHNLITNVSVASEHAIDVCLSCSHFYYSLPFFQSSMQVLVRPLKPMIGPPFKLFFFRSCPVGVIAESVDLVDSRHWAICPPLPIPYLPSFLAHPSER